MTYAATILSEPSLTNFLELGDAPGTTHPVDAQGGVTSTAANVVFGAAAQLVGDASTGATFNGATSNISVGTAAVGNFGKAQAFTVEFLVRPNVTRAGAAVPYAVVSKWDGANAGWEVRLMWNSGQNSTNKTIVHVLMRDATGTQEIDVYSTETDLVNGTSFHVLVAYDGGGLNRSFRILVDGFPEVCACHGAPVGAGSDITNAVVPNIGSTNDASNFFHGDLQDVAIYADHVAPHGKNHYSIAIANSAALTALMAFSPPQPSPSTLDDDYNTDVASVGGCALFFAFSRRGEIAPIASVIDTNLSYAPAVQSALATFSGKPALPIGQTTEALGVGSAWGTYVKNEFPNTPPVPVPDAVLTYRAALNAAANGSVVMVSMGFLSCLAGLLASGSNYGGDGILQTGLQLVTAKVLLLVVMGGNYDTTGEVTTIYPGNAEHNFALDPTDAASVVASWPAAVPVIFSGFEVGYTILGCGASLQNHPVNSPYRAAYIQAGQTGGRPGWNETAVLIHARGPAPSQNSVYFDLSKGQNSVSNVTGVSTFTIGAGNQYYARKVMGDIQLAALFNSLEPQSQGVASAVFR